MRYLQIIAWMLIAAVIGAVTWPIAYPIIVQEEEEISFIQIGGPFSMTDHDGRAVTEKNFAGKAKAIFFGYTTCPDVCPTTLSRLSGLMDQLGPDASKLQVILVSVDPAHDTPKVLKPYLEAFDPRFVGLTGTPEQLAAFARNYRIFYEKVPDSSGGYTMNHSAGVFLFGQSGEFQGTIDREETDKVALEKLNLLLDR